MAGVTKKNDAHLQPFFARNAAHDVALPQLNAVAASLRNSADKLKLGADSNATRLPALIRRLYNKCCRDPLEKTRTDHGGRPWSHCWAAQRKGKSWPETHDRAIQEVADSCEHPDCGWRSSKILDISRTIRRAHQILTPDPTSSSRWPGTISPKQEPI